MPHLDEYYAAVQASIFDDSQAGGEALYEAFKDRYGVGPINQRAFPIYAWFQLWLKAATKAVTTDGKSVVAEMEKFRSEPTALGPRTFTHDLHIPNQIPMAINDISNEKGKVVAIVTDAPELPRDVLYRLGKKE